MKLHSTIIIDLSQEEEERIIQLLNGCKYFKKYYAKLCMFYGGIDRMKLDRLTESLEMTKARFKDGKTTYDMALWWNILKLIKVMELEYVKHVGLDNCLYLEFLRMQNQQIRGVLEEIWKKINIEEG